MISQGHSDAHLRLLCHIVTIADIRTARPCLFSTRGLNELCRPWACSDILHGVLVCLMSLQWRHNGRDSVSYHKSDDCLLKRLFRWRSTKTPKLRVTGLCAGNLSGTGELPAQMARNAENISIWWRRHVVKIFRKVFHGISSSWESSVLWRLQLWVTSH